MLAGRRHHLRDGFGFLFETLYQQPVEPVEPYNIWHGIQRFFAGHPGPLVLQPKIFFQQLRRNTVAQHKTGQRLAIRPAQALVFVEHHVQDHVVVGGVGVVPVCQPVGGIQVDFHVASPQRFVQANAGIEKIRPGMQVRFAGMQDFERLTVGGKLFAGIKPAPAPQKMKEVFAHGEIVLLISKIEDL